MALTLQLQKPPHSLGGGEAEKGEAASQGTFQSSLGLKCECPDVCWTWCWLASGATGCSLPHKLPLILLDQIQGPLLPENLLGPTVLSFL